MDFWQGLLAFTAFFGISVSIEKLPIKLKPWTMLKNFFTSGINDNIKELKLDIYKKIDNTNKRITGLGNKLDEMTIQRLRNDIIEYNEDEKHGIKKTDIQYDTILEEYRIYHDVLKKNGYIQEIMNEIKERRKKLGK